MSIKYYDTNGKYWGKFDETRGLFIPSEEVLADRKTEPQTKDLFTDEDGDVWEWRGDAWYCISGDTQTERQRLEGKRWTDTLTTEEKKCMLDILI